MRIRFDHGYPIHGIPDEGGISVTPPNDGPVLLADGVYCQSADASSKLPVTGQGWLLTTNLSNGVSGDTTTRETGTSASITVLHVHKASPLTIAGWDLTCKWKGDIVIPNAYKEGNGFSWTTLANIAGAPLTHAAYTDEQIPALFGPEATSKGYHVAVISCSDTSGGFMSCSDSRIS